VFYNTQFFTPGNNAAKSIRDAMAAAGSAVAATASIRHTELVAEGTGLVPEEYVLANPALNFAQLLLRAVLPTVLHVVIAISAGYAVGSEFRRRSMREWFELADRSIATALVGKLLPYFVVLMLMFVLVVGILDVWLGVSLRGSAGLMAVSAPLLIIARLRDVRIRFTQKLLVDLADARLCQAVDELDLLGDSVFRDYTSRRERLQVRFDIGFLTITNVVAVLGDKRKGRSPHFSSGIPITASFTPGHCSISSSICSDDPFSAALDYILDPIDD
jgi:hypothetical protein